MVKRAAKQQRQQDKYNKAISGDQDNKQAVIGLISKMKTGPMSFP